MLRGSFSTVSNITMLVKKRLISCIWFNYMTDKLAEYTYVAGQAGIPEHFDGCVCLRFLNTLVCIMLLLDVQIDHLIEYSVLALWPRYSGNAQMHSMIVWYSVLNIIQYLNMIFVLVLQLCSLKTKYVFI